MVASDIAQEGMEDCGVITTACRSTYRLCLVLAHSSPLTEHPVSLRGHIRSAVLVWWSKNSMLLAQSVRRLRVQWPRSPKVLARLSGYGSLLASHETPDANRTKACGVQNKVQVEVTRSPPLPPKPHPIIANELIVSACCFVQSKRRSCSC
jgi:hypothetical protein